MKPFQTPHTHTDTHTTHNTKKKERSPEPRGAKKERTYHSPLAETSPRLLAS